MTINGYGLFLDAVQYMNWIPPICELHMLPVCKIAQFCEIKKTRLYGLLNDIRLNVNFELATAKVFEDTDP